jgi:addiction module RelB/DinJ family antitoxin
MNTAVISVRTDPATKQKAGQVAKRFGIPLSTLINAYLHELADSGQIHFSSVEVMTPKMERLVAEIEAEISSGQVSGPFDNAEDFLADLKK